MNGYMTEQGLHLVHMQCRRGSSEASYRSPTPWVYPFLRIHAVRTLPVAVSTPGEDQKPSV